MIQLGSILAVVWLYRAKIVDGRRAGCRRRPDGARGSRCMIVARRRCRRSSPARCSRSSSKSVLYGSFGGDRGGVHRRRRRHAGRRAVPAGARRAATWTACRSAARSRSARARRWRSFPACRGRAATIVAAMAMRVDRRGGGRVLVLSGDADDGGGVRARAAGGAARARRRRAALEIAVGFVMAFVASALVVKPFLSYVRRSGFAPFAWYRIALGAGAARGGRRAAGCRRVMQWLRRSFIAGFFVTVPLFISVAAFIWIFGVVDGLTTPFYDRLLGPADSRAGHRCRRRWRSCWSGAFATNVIGRRVLQRGEGWLLRVPVFRTIYAPVKQLVVAFSPDNEFGFKRVVMVEDARRGYVLGFLTREFTVDRGQRAGAAAGGLRADQPPLSGRHRHLRARARVVSRHHGRGRHPDLPDRRHGAAAAGARSISRPFVRGFQV